MVDDRLQLLHEFPIAGSCLYWIVGFLFYQHVGYCLYCVRVSVKKDIFDGLLAPAGIVVLVPVHTTCAVVCVLVYCTLLYYIHHYLHHCTHSTVYTLLCMVMLMLVRGLKPNKVNRFLSSLTGENIAFSV